MASKFSIPGIGSGIDWGAYIDSIIGADVSAFQKTVGKREINLTAEKTAYANIQGALGALKTAVQSFKFSGDFKQKNVVSSDSKIVTGTATLDAIQQTATISVNSLATNEVARLNFASVDASVHNGATATATITVRGTASQITVESGTTLKQLAQKINSARIGVTATVYDSGDGTGTPARLVIKDNKLGTWEQASPTNMVFTSFATTLDQISGNPTITAATDAEVEINGETITSRSNTISGVLPGVTLQLLGTGDDVNMSVVESTANASKNLQNLRDAYNNVVSLIKKSIAIDPSAKEQTNPLAGNSGLRNILSRLQSGMTGTVQSIPSSKSVRSLSDLGIRTSFDAASKTSDGSLTIDESVFNDKLANNYEDVITFFEGFTANSTHVDGWSDRIGGIMDSILAIGTGSVPSRMKAIDEALKVITVQKDRKLEQLTRKEEMLTAKFSRLETQLAGLNQQQSSLTSALNSIALNNQAIARR